MSIIATSLIRKMPCTVFNTGDDLSGFNPFYGPTYLENKPDEVSQFSHTYTLYVYTRACNGKYTKFYFVGRYTILL